MLNKNAYNKIAAQWAESRDRSFVSELVVDFADRVRPNGAILDIGCGTGHPLASWLAEKGYRVKGIDASEKMIEIALSRNIKNAEFQVVDFFEYATSQKFDGILAWDSFFHFPLEKQETIYPKIAEWLHPGGYLLFTHGYEEGEIAGEMMGENFYYSCLSKEKVMRILKELHFEVKFIYEDYKERDTDRGLVILAQKIMPKTQNAR